MSGWRLEAYGRDRTDHVRPTQRSGVNGAADSRSWYDRSVSTVEIVTIVAGVVGIMFAAWRVAAYYSRLNADAHKALGDRIEANGQAIARVEGKVDTLIEMLRPRV